MNNSRRKRRGVSGKVFIALLALVLLVGGAIGGTVAWLVTSSGSVTNTFTYGDINIELWEHGYDAEKNTLTETKVTKVENYKIIPGVTLPKDPTVTVKKGSEDCYLFVQVTESGTFVQGKVTYTVDTSKWTALSEHPGVYYCTVSAAEVASNDQDISILNGNQVLVSDTLTKEDIQAITTSPKLTFTAYAVQQDGISSPEEAWTKVSTAAPTPTAPAPG